MPFKDFTTYGDNIKFSVFDTTGHTPAILETTELTHQPLKPCPFCGGDAEVIEREAHNAFEGLAVRCKRCLCGTAPEYAGRTTTLSGYVKADTSLADVLKSVVDKWNTRTAENVQNENEGGITKDNGGKKNVRKNNNRQ